MHKKVSQRILPCISLDNLLEVNLRVTIKTVRIDLLQVTTTVATGHPPGFLGCCFRSYFRNLFRSFSWGSQSKGVPSIISLEVFFRHSSMSFLVIRLVDPVGIAPGFPPDFFVNCFQGFLSKIPVIVIEQTPGDRFS